jgi:hypothetical protein
VPVKIAALAVIALNVVALVGCVSECFHPRSKFKMLVIKRAPPMTGLLFLFAFPVNIPIKPQAYVPAFHWSFYSL